MFSFHCFVYLLFSIAKVVTIFEYPNKILLFIENLCFCSLKISGASKNCRLKITEWSKNFGASVGKPSGVVQVFRTSERIAGSTGRKAGERQRESHKGRAGEDAGTHDHRRRAGEQQTNKYFVLYIGIEKYFQKS